MKTTLNLAVAAVILSLSGLAEARPYHHDRGPVVVTPGYGAGHGGGRPHHRMSLQARAQLRLRELGFYRGPIDGAFGPGSRRALVRFQQRRGLAVTGWLDVQTQRALRL
ncbi:MAG: putative peptidoglycan binding protein [Akkermansiaceae bacterium]|nr:putative peptidoglycan binding protein [Akkermansiaceae bacterium]